MGKPFNDVINLSKAILCHKKKAVEGLNILHCTKINNLRAMETTICQTSDLLVKGVRI